jgi:transglutaminase-like putative cysteine protease
LQSDAELAAFARTAFTPRRPLLAAAVDLMQRIHDEFQFDPGATTITTPVSRVLSERRGVCQDFALCRSPVSDRSASGALHQRLSPHRSAAGQPAADSAPMRRMRGSSVCCPRHGWVDLDPTNAVFRACVT